MSDIKILNLDDLDVESRVQIVLNGKSHSLVEMTVKNFIWVQKEMARLQKASDSTEHFDMLVEILARQFPTAKIEEFQSLTLNKLRALMDFVNDLAVSGAEAAVSKAQDRDDSENPPMAAQAA